jgi:putative oxidoreductase
MAGTAVNVGGAHRRILHGSLWVAQILLALAYGMAGLMKSTQPIPSLVQNGIGWAPDVPFALLRFIGISELAGAIGVVLPAATGILPWLTPMAAAGLTLVQGLAIVFHLTRGEVQAFPINLMLGGLSLFVLWGRTKVVPVASR